MPRRLSSKPAETGEVIAFPVPVKAKNPMAVALGKLGGSKGGKIRAAKLTQEQRTDIARRAGLARQAIARQKKAEANTSRLGGSS